jgi:ribosomal protein S6E (S10)
VFRDADVRVGDSVQGCRCQSLCDSVEGCRCRSLGGSDQAGMPMSELGSGVQGC